MRIALLDDDPKEWKRFTEALRGWEPRNVLLTAPLF